MSLNSRASTLSRESHTIYSLSQIFGRAEQIRPTNEEEGASENRSKHSGETSNSGTKSSATSHLSGFIPKNESFGVSIPEEGGAYAAASR